MQSNMLMLSWVAGALPTSRYQALLCSAGSVGYTALRQSLGSPLYPQHTILLTNVDMALEDVSDARHIPQNGHGTNVRIPTFSYLLRETEFVSNLRKAQYLLKPHLHVAPVSNVSAAPWQLFANCKSLKTIDFIQMANLKDLRFEFLKGCSSLTDVDLSPLTQVTKLPPWFLTECKGLSTVDFSPLQPQLQLHTTSIPLGFLAGCTGLRRIDLSPFCNVTEVGMWFLLGCSSITIIDLTPLRNVTKLNNGFLCGCAALTEIDISPLCQISEVPWRFLSGCAGLTTLDFRPLQNLLSAPSSPDTLPPPPHQQPPTSPSDSGGGGFVTLPVEFLEGCTRLAIIYNPPSVSAPPPGWEEDDAKQYWKRDGTQIK